MNPLVRNPLARNPLARLWNRLRGLFAGTGEKRKGAANLPKNTDPRPFLMGSAPGLWASNHLAESQRCEGWQFVAVRAQARMSSQGTLAVYEVGTKAQKSRRLRRAWKLAKLLGQHHKAQSIKARLGTLEPGKKPAPQGDPLAELLKRPNPQWSLSTLLFACAQQLALTGSCLLWAVRNELGQIIELYVLPTGLTTPRMPSSAFPQGSYYLTPLSAFGLRPPGDGFASGTLGTALLVGAEIDARDVKAIRWPHPLYLSDGLSPLEATALWVDVAGEMDRATFYAMQHAEKPGLMFSMDPEVDPDVNDVTQFREDLRTESAGTSNTGKHLIVPKGFKAERRGAAPEDLDYQHGQKAYRDKSLAAHAVSPVACGITEAGSYAQFWAGVKQTTELVIRPTLGLIAGELTELLGDQFEGPRREIALEPPSIDDPQLHDQKSRRWLQSGNAVTVNEWRALEGLPQLPAPLGEQFVGIQVTATSKDTSEEPGVQPEGEDGDGDDGTSDDDSTGQRRQDRDRPPGRADGAGKSNGKVYTNGFHARWR